MCHNEQFLNLWIKDCPFSLDYLSDLLGTLVLVLVCDDKSGYDHICLSPSSRTLFGLSWKGCYFVYNTLPFGWKASADVYHSTGLLATSYIRTLGVPCSQYIDDRHAGQLMVREKPTSPIWSDIELGPSHCFYSRFSSHFTGLYARVVKIVPVQSQRVRFLGYFSDSVLMAFVFPEDKKLKFNTLREFIFSQKSVDLKTLERFAGKTTSFSIAFPTAQLYKCASFSAFSSSSKSPHKPFFVAGDLLQEIQYWGFLDNWQGCLTWFDERHVVISTFSDASNSG